MAGLGGIGSMISCLWLSLILWAVIEPQLKNAGKVGSYG
jgi:hypothetical protein